MSIVVNTFLLSDNLKTGYWAIKVADLIFSAAFFRVAREEMLQLLDTSRAYCIISTLSFKSEVRDSGCITPLSNSSAKAKFDLTAKQEETLVYSREMPMFLKIKSLP